MYYLIVIKKFGGSAEKGMNGKQQYAIDTTAMDVLFVVPNDVLLFPNIQARNNQV